MVTEAPGWGIWQTFHGRNRNGPFMKCDLASMFLRLRSGHGGNGMTVTDTGNRRIPLNRRRNDPESNWNRCSAHERCTRSDDSEG